MNLSVRGCPLETRWEKRWGLVTRLSIRDETPPNSLTLSNISHPVHWGLLLSFHSQQNLRSVGHPLSSSEELEKGDEKEVRRLHPAGRQHPGKMGEMDRRWRTTPGSRVEGMGGQGENKAEIGAPGSKGREAAGSRQPGSLCSTLRKQVTGKRVVCHTHPPRFRKGLSSCWRVEDRDVLCLGVMLWGYSLVFTNRHCQYLGSKIAGEGQTFRKSLKQSLVCVWREY